MKPENASSYSPLPSICRHLAVSWSPWRRCSWLLCLIMAAAVALSIPVWRPAKAQDTGSLIAGIAALSDGQKLLQEGTPKATNQAVLKFEEALRLFRNSATKEVKSPRSVAWA
jgi:hypothetical protein